ncbi:MAG: hypothetical protein PHI97_01910 [Desulfobulbus sp.]|nr:hypothetical protein [Desulfobulbus sp.]
MKNAVLISVFCCVLGAGGAFAASGENTHAGQAFRESGAASVHASGSAAHALVSSGQVTSAVSSVPLAVSGATITAAGAASASAAVGMSKAANSPAGKPLPITNESLVTVPPDQALKKP